MKQSGVWMEMMRMLNFEEKLLDAMYIIRCFLEPGGSIEDAQGLQNEARAFLNSVEGLPQQKPGQNR